jgi:hypothetical protein
MYQVRATNQTDTTSTTEELMMELNPLVPGWGEYYKRAHVCKLFHRLTAGSADEFGRIDTSIGAMATATGTVSTRLCG